MSESDVTIQEGLTRQVPIRRTSITSQTWIKVYVTTVEGYRQRELTADGCSLTLADLGVDMSRDDPAEGKMVLLTHVI